MQVIPASCPQCGTQYQLTPQHLAVANGKVRCGVCNTIFQAAPPAAPQIPTPPINPASKSQFVNNDDEMLLNDTGVRNSFDKKSHFKTGEFSSSFTNNDDELIQDNMHDDEPDNKFDSMLDNFEISDEFSNFGGSKKELPDETDEEEWASKLLDDEGIDAEKVIKGEEPPKKQPKASPRQALGSSSDDFDFDDFEGLDTSALSLSKSEEEDLGFGTSGKNEIINKIKPEPLVFQILNQRSLLSTIGLSILGVIAVLGLTLQLFFFQIDTLSRDPKWHSLYTGVCGIIGCTLPDQFDIADIKATNLTVKSHPHYRNSLIIDAIIVNHANILQPFPNIELFFMNIDQEIIAARQFKPSEYLRGELVDATLMPSRQSVHLALEIDDPSKNATGYSIKLSY